MRKKSIPILGVKYTLTESDQQRDPRLALGCDGYCDTSIKSCVIDAMIPDDPACKQNLPEYKKQVIRHELIHAFLHESGLDGESWAASEELVDWIAIQFPKLRDAFIKADCL